tara:strand:- start:106 stop:408 length:303 start_codon:yes stop_codon:yes gene_type:complete
MITEIVTMVLPKRLDADEVLSKFHETAERWKKNPDLIRKHYLLDRINNTIGGVYLWHQREHAEKWHGNDFRKQAKALYGAEPKIQIFETPIIIDNWTDKN